MRRRIEGGVRLSDRRAADPDLSKEIRKKTAGLEGRGKHQGGGHVFLDE